MVIVLSPDYIDHPPDEWGTAYVRDPGGARGLLIPVMVRPCVLPPGSFGTLEPIDLGLWRASAQVAEKRLFEAIEGAPVGGAASTAGPVAASGTSAICPGCGLTNRANAQFCNECGKPLKATVSLAHAGAARAGGSALLQDGTVLQQKYRITGQVGKGGFGSVYRAEEVALGNRPLAIKEMLQDGLGPQELALAQAAFKREALLLAGLWNPHLPRIYAHFEEGGRWYLVMDFVPGETLEAYLGRGRGGRLPLEEVFDIGVQLATVLEYLHGRQPPVIFRDLKPANVMRSPDGHLYLIDFGIARHFKPGQARDTRALGSPGYAAPEQYGRQQTTERSDIYSLGATLHQLASGDDPADKPFQFDALRGVPPAFADLIARMLDMNEGRRPASMDEIKHELRQIAAGAAAGSPQAVSTSNVVVAQARPAVKKLSSPSTASARGGKHKTVRFFLISAPLVDSDASHASCQEDAQMLREILDAVGQLDSRLPAHALEWDYEVGWGQDIVTETSALLQQADIVLVLITPALLAAPMAKHLVSMAIERQVEEQVPVVPVYLRKCDWKSKLAFLAANGGFPGGRDNDRSIEEYPDRHAKYQEMVDGFARMLSSSLWRPQQQSNVPFPGGS